MIKPPIQIVWFRRDLRLSDHAALTAASQNETPIIALTIEEDSPQTAYPHPGSSSKGWWQRSLHHLKKSLNTLHIPLLYMPYRLERALNILQQHFQLTALWCHRYEEPHLATQDQRNTHLLKQMDIPFHLFPANLLFSPGEILKDNHEPYLVFTAFWKRCLQLLEVTIPLPVPSRLIGAQVPKQLLSYGILPDPIQVPWGPFWHIGEENTHEVLACFLTKQLSAYEEARNFPALSGTSRMSAPLHFGEITPRQILYAARELPNTDCFFKEIGWREFAHHTIHFFPNLPFESLYRRMKDFPYRDDPLQLKAWQQGLTGYPIVDAGMRELTSRGTIHNRVRMIVGSFLTKDLLLPWQEGAKWFWEHLVDADLAANSLNWQWVAGSGIDPQPFFRIFHPVTQGKKFDPTGEYIRTFLPELTAIPNQWIHNPWEADPAVLKKAGVVLGRDYPYPVVDHAFARTRALETYRHLGGAE